MNRDLAIAVFKRWDDGLPVNERIFYKAASVLVENPDLALAEARYYTILDSYLSRGGPMTSIEKNAFCLAYGNVKTASIKTRFDEYALLRTLCENEFIPDLNKLANLSGPPQDADVQQNQDQRQGAVQDPESIQQLTGNPAALMDQDWQGNPLYKPTPTAPGQLPPGGQGDSGNMNQLVSNNANKDQIEAQKQQAMVAQQAEQTKEQPQQGSKEQIQMLYNQMTPEQKLQHAAPQVAPEDIQRYAQELSKIEQQTGIKIKDPAQVKKVVGGVEKKEKKIIDEAIKAQFEQNNEMYGPLPGQEGADMGQGQAQDADPAGTMKMAETGKERAHRYGLTGAVASGIGTMGVPQVAGTGVGALSSAGSFLVKNKKTIENMADGISQGKAPDLSAFKGLGKSIKRRAIAGNIAGGIGAAALGYGAGRLTHRLAHGAATDNQVKKTAAPITPYKEEKIDSDTNHFGKLRETRAEDPEDYGKIKKAVVLKLASLLKKKTFI